MLAMTMQPVDVKADQAARAFYGAYRRAAISGLPTPAQMRTIGAHLSDALQHKLAAAQQAQSRCRTQHPGEKEPWAEGDLFTSNFESFTRVVRVATHPGTAGDGVGVVVVDFEYAEGQSRVTWTDHLVLKKEQGRWLVDDVRYGRSPGATLRKSLGEPGC